MIICGIGLFFYRNLSCLYPQKRVVEFILKTQPDKNIILKSPENQNEYHFEVEDIWLDLNFIHLEVSVCHMLIMCLLYVHSAPTVCPDVH